MNKITAYWNDLKRFPKATPYILGNEAAERFSFYGMKAILTTFLATTFYVHYGNSHAAANETTHMFISAAYMFSVLGGLLADWMIGKYKTILWLSIVYVIGHLCLALFELNLNGFMFGLFLIALGSGGIKPCVSANVGDQFDASNKNLISKLYDIFYFSINFGAFFSQLTIPYLKEHYGPAVAFGIPGVLMAIATVIFWMGRKRYNMVQPTGEHKKLAMKLLGLLGIYGVLRLLLWQQGMEATVVMGMQLSAWLIVAMLVVKLIDSYLYPTNVFLDVNLHALLNLGKKKSDVGFLDSVKGMFPADRIDGFKEVWKVLVVFSFIPVFWALYDQNGSEWVLQATQLDLNFMGRTWLAEQVQSINAVLILVFVPVFSIFLYPMVNDWGIKVTPLRKIGMGFLLTCLSFVIIAWIQSQLDAGLKPNVGWQILAYVILTAGEVMVSVTGLEYAYTQAPLSMKSTVMAFWLLTVSVGNYLVSSINSNIQNHGFFSQFDGASYYWLFCGVMAGTTVVYVFVTMMIKPKPTFATPSVIDIHE
ncbi:MAG: POT family MFS transporter [Bacteroidetes bacterium]|nr:POT family MFS transporter [Bacteroidota bacterium]